MCVFVVWMWCYLKWGCRMFMLLNEETLHLSLLYTEIVKHHIPLSGLFYSIRLSISFEETMCDDPVMLNSVCWCRMCSPSFQSHSQSREHTVEGTCEVWHSESLSLSLAQWHCWTIFHLSFIFVFHLCVWCSFMSWYSLFSEGWMFFAVSFTSGVLVTSGVMLINQKTPYVNNPAG